MKKNIRKVAYLVSILALLSVPAVSKAVVIAHDTVTLTENGKRITDNSVLWRASYETYFQVCEKGVCSIGQQFYPVTFYRTKK